ncbi:Ribosomal RNA small subunit methyltransferase B [Roseovarius sp. THAF27]|uniref:RsmB/NOP family class I SAM-dependent RNA methyltransferase n=1 Tax=Roseovarius sp. THAF27 TaxID=2587850 RepID=UPI001268243B|nr:RsmB/NOP family class I SAM-dependent RNA methyltransferase [Roseovarius sp. THAF27]QFT80860.1 Ribosomal RNA small subunit methyltransferase B [Roseovarius sp. THAF27]
MTPAARVQAAIEVLDSVASGMAAEQALTRWARGARYAGSKDRAAVRDHVFSVLRRRRSCAALGGGDSGRALMLGLLRGAGEDTDAIFSGEGHAPAPLDPVERHAGRTPTPQETRDLPDWLWERFATSLGGEATRAAEALRHRAPVCLRLNPGLKTDADVIDMLEQDGIALHPVPDIKGAVLVTAEARRVTQSRAYRDGLVEVQDTSSQAAMAALEVPPGARGLDYCAGGGGKVLALASRIEGAWFAHDAAPRRMRDLPQRAARAGVTVTLLDAGAVSGTAPFDLVLCDVPCSGSGTWRRTPEAKWTLTPERLADLCRTQRSILQEAQALVRPGGMLAYTTCSVLDEENAGQVAAFLAASSGWVQEITRHWPVSEVGDGFFLSVLRKPQ